MKAIIYFFILCVVIGLLDELLGRDNWCDNIFEPVLAWFFYLWPRLSRHGRELELWYDFEVAPVLTADAEAAGLGEYDLLLLRRAAINRWLAVEKMPWLEDFAHLALRAKLIERRRDIEDLAALAEHPKVGCWECDLWHLPSGDGIDCS